MANKNFYQELDLRYAEIGIAMTKIDRHNPGKVPFTIPVLTPLMDNNKTTITKMIERDKSQIQNVDNNTIDTSDIEISNTIYIEIPRELCALPGANYDIEGTIKGTHKSSIEGTLSTSATKMIGRGSVSTQPIGSINVEGTISSFNSNLSGSGDTSIKFTGNMNAVLSDKDRYIPEKSKWLIMFIGGDINMPVVISRIPDSI